MGIPYALEGQRIGPEEGSCGTAAYLKKPVIVSDIETDPLWKNYRELALGYNLRSCWSTPVLNKNGDVLGTFAMYYNDCRSPLDSDFELIEHITSVTAITIQRKIEEEELLNHRENLELLVKTRTDELEKEKEKAESADRLKSAFLASMSHELRTPLNSIIGFTGVLLKGRPGPLTAEQVKQLNIIQYSSQHLLDLINDVLDISKIEADQMKVVYEKFNLNELICSIADSLQPQVKKKGLAMEVSVSGENNMIFSDKVRVKQIILNVVNNAVKFTEKGSVNIFCHKEEKKYIIRISDTGPGIPEDQLSVLFKPFIQVDSGIARRHEGTGLGLYICKKLLQLLGGIITVESKPCTGSAFSIVLPVKPEN